MVVEGIVLILMPYFELPLFLIQVFFFIKKRLNLIIKLQTSNGEGMRSMAKKIMLVDGKANL